MIDSKNIIAEIGQAHDGSLGQAHAYIDALATTGVGTVKFQMHIAEAESSKEEQFRIPFSFQDKSRYDYWKRMEFTYEQWEELKKHCESKNLEFLVSPFSMQAFDFLEKLKVQRYKIGSGEACNYLLLDSILSTGKHLILSTGLSRYKDIDSLFESHAQYAGQISLLKCTTEYPSPSNKWDLKGISALQDRYHVPVGYSDHSGLTHVLLAAAALKASLFEFHVVFDKMMFGPDSSSSICIRDIPLMVRGIKEISYSLDNEFSDLSEFDNALRENFGKSLALRKDLKQGDALTVHDLETKKPAGLGIRPINYKSILGKTLNKDMRSGDFLNYSDLD